MTQRKYFGTDGIRGKVGESNINPEFVTKLGWAAGKVLAGRGTNKVLIGRREGGGSSQQLWLRRSI